MSEFTSHSLLGFRKTFVHPHPSIFHDSDDHDGDDGDDAIHAIHDDHGDHATIHDVRDGGDDLAILRYLERRPPIRQ